MSWEYAKQILDRGREPEDIQMAKYFDGGSHESRGETHTLVQYKLPIKVLEFNGLFEWSFCKSCKKCRHKSMVIFNNETNQVYTRDIIKHEEQVKHHE